MSNNSLLNSPSALNDFLIIINAYGAFLKERELVKKRKHQKNNLSIIQLINSHKIDHYSSASREFGFSDGLTESAANEINYLITSTFSEEYESLKRNLISTEKYFKKLHIIFKYTIYI